MSWSGRVFCFLLSVATLHLAAGVAVMSVDLGSEWMKIAVVSVCSDNPNFILINSIIHSSPEFQWRSP